MRRSTLRMRSTPGIKRIKPGPRAPTSRPRRKITPRSYSCTILTAEVTTRKATTTTATRTTTMLGTIRLLQSGRSVYGVSQRCLSVS